MSLRKKLNLKVPPSLKLGESGTQMSVVTGLPILQPPIRQSKTEDFWRCPRYFAWRHRFGVAPKKVGVGAVAPYLGGLFHQYMEDWEQGIAEEDTFARQVSELNAAISKLAEWEDKEGPPGLGSKVETEQEKGLTTIYKARAMARVYQNSYPRTVKEETVLVEADMSVQLPGFKSPIEGVLDKLYKTDTGEYWIRDYKTVGRSLSVRAVTLAFEVQKVIYKLLGQAYLHSIGEDPRKLVGIHHGLVGKPLINFGREDRPFTETTRVIARGKNKGETVTEKTYYGEPDFENYAGRVHEWFSATGHYETDKYKIQGNPRLLESNIRFASSGLSAEDLVVLKEIDDASTVVPTLQGFYKRRTGCVWYNTPCAYLRLCESHPSTWKEELTRGYDLGVGGELEGAASEDDLDG